MYFFFNLRVVNTSKFNAISVTRQCSKVPPIVPVRSKSIPCTCKYRTTKLTDKPGSGTVGKQCCTVFRGTRTTTIAIYQKV